MTRFVLSVGEPGSYPSAIDAVGEWFAARERALRSRLEAILSGVAACGYLVALAAVHLPVRRTA